MQIKLIFELWNMAPRHGLVVWVPHTAKAQGTAMWPRLGTAVRPPIRGCIGAPQVDMGETPNLGFVGGLGGTVSTISFKLWKVQTFRRIFLSINLLAAGLRYLGLGT